MQFTYKDANGVPLVVRVDFGYAIRDGKDFVFAGRALSNIAHKRVFTFVNIATRPDENPVLGKAPPEFNSIAGAYAIRHPSDSFIKAVGRRTALGEAVTQIGDRNLRKAIWDEYMATHKDGKEIVANREKSIKPVEAIPVQVKRRFGFLDALRGR